MSTRNDALLADLREVASILRANGGADATELLVSIDRLVRVVERSDSGPLAFLQSMAERKRAKFTWCLPTCELDDCLVGDPRGVVLGNAIYAAL